MLGIPLSDLLTYTNAAYLFSLFLTFVLTVSLWRVSVAAQNANELELERYKLEADTRIEEARKSAHEADDRAAEANKAAEIAKEAIARAEARIATAEAATAAAKTEQARFEASFTWRLISQTNGSAAQRMLSTNRGSIKISFVSNDQETTAVSLQLMKIFTSAGWNVSMSADVFAGSLIFDVFTAGSDTAKLELVQSVLQITGLKLNSGPLPTPSMGFAPIGAPTQQPDVAIVIGAKMPEVAKALLAPPP